MYEIDCSISDISDYIDKLSSNEYNLKKHFDSPASGELGEIQGIFQKNFEVVKQVADDSKTKMYEDISLAWNVRDHNEKVKQALEGKERQLEQKVGQQKETVAAAEKSLKMAEQRQTRVENTKTPYFSNTEEGRAARERFEDRLEKDKANAQKEVNNAESRVSNAESTLKNLETSKANVRARINELVTIDKKLFDFIGKTQAEIAKIETYVSQCERVLDSVKTCLERLSQDHKKLTGKTTGFKRKAEEAQGLVRSIGASLAKTAEKTYNESDKIKVISHSYLSNMADSLGKTKSQMDKLNDIIDEIVKKFGSVMQDNVTRKTVSGVNSTSEQVGKKTEDFPAKAKHFSNAADDLFAYSNL